MKKSELKQRISELEIERDNAVSYQEMWKESANAILKQLIEHGVHIDVDMPETPMIECTTGCDMKRKFVKGKVDGVPVITFDFTEHDMNVLRKQGVIE